MDDPRAYDALLRAALAEDLGEAGDITSQAVIPEEASARGRVVARAAGVVAGAAVCARVFELVDDRVEADLRTVDGARVTPGHVILEVHGPARALLAAERTALNLLGHLSGVATATRELVELVAGTGAAILDTRKTLPGLRALEKAAVRAGGGRNHRLGLFDAVLIKDNHITVAGSPAEAVRRARTHVGPDVTVEVEIESLDDLEAVLEAGADVVLLDNMSPDEMRAAVEQAAGRCVLEASGGIGPDTVRRVAETGVDRISVGRITHSAPALDVALDFQPLAPAPSALP